MPNTLKLALAAALALLAAYANQTYLKRRLATEQFVVVSSKVLRGQKLTADKLTAVALAGQTADLVRIAIPYRERAAVEDRIAPRDFEPGELLIRPSFETPPKKIPVLPKNELPIFISLQNIPHNTVFLRVGQWVYFGVRQGEDRLDTTQPIERIGPFRIVAIGRNLDEEFTDDTPGQAGEREITVAGRVGLSASGGSGFDAASERLDQANSGLGGARLVSIYPDSVRAAQSAAVARSDRGTAPETPPTSD
ncbi:MAG: hypothetical protein JSS02_28260 [Planctomycetes bacterium]|nr:hypothetical protein [Planctomycetota bacterium]